MCAVYMKHHDSVPSALEKTGDALISFEISRLRHGAHMNDKVRANIMVGRSHLALGFNDPCFYGRSH